MRILIAFAITTSLMAQGQPVPKPAPVAPKATAKAKKPADIVAIITAPDQSVRTIHYNERLVETVYAKLNFTTVFIFPPNEKVMDVIAGNTDQWTANGSQGTNLVYIRPDKSHAKTNMNAVMASGNVYSFLVVEGEGNPDLKVFVSTERADMLAAISAKPKWVLATELDIAKKQADEATKEADDARADFNKRAAEMTERSDREIATFRSGFPSSLKHDYKFKQKQNEFGVHAMAHDKERTFIWADPQEVPTLYEKRDGKPSLINFMYSNGVYSTDKVLDSGYLQVGKKHLDFYREN